MSKYLPLIPSTSGELARYVGVSAPSTTVMAVSFMAILRVAANQPRLLCPNLVSTNPGCKALTVISVASNRSAKLYVNMILASLDWL